MARDAEGAPPSSRDTSSPQGAQSSPSRAASSTMKTWRLGTSQWCTAMMNPMPPIQPSSAALRGEGAVRISNSQGTSAT